MVKKYNPWHRHRNHQTRVLPGTGPHVAKYWCVKCNKFIAWIDQADLELLKGK